MDSRLPIQKSTNITTSAITKQSHKNILKITNKRSLVLILEKTYSKISSNLNILSVKKNRISLY